MRIALNGLFWGQPYTGSGQYLRRLWRYLPTLPESAGHEFVLLHPGAWPGGEAPPAEPGQRTVVAPAGPFAARSANLSKIWWEQIGLPLAARRVRADLLHSPYLAAPLAAPCPVVVTAHDLIPWALPDYRRSAPLRLYMALARGACRRARLLLADSAASRRDVLRFFRVPPGRVRTILLGIEPEFGAPIPPDELAALRARFNLPPAYAFYIGGFDERKDVPLLLRAWAAALPRLHAAGGTAPVLAVGGHLPPPGGLFPDLPALARRLGLQTADDMEAPLRFLGRVSEEDKRRLLAGARLFAFPSRYEGFGYDPLEAMAAGTPVICAAGSSLPEVVDEAGLLLPPCEVDTWADAFVRIWHDADLRTDLTARGRAQAARFRPETTAALTLRAYLDAGSPRLNAGPANPPPGR